MALQGFDNMSVTEKVVTSFIVMLLAWMAVTTNTTATKVAVIEATINSLAQNRYTALDAARDLALVKSSIGNNERRISDLEEGHK